MAMRLKLIQIYLIALIVFFSRVGPDLANSINSTGDKSFSYYLKQNIYSSFEFTCIEIPEVRKTINDLSSKNSNGCDSISSKLLKRISAFFIEEPLRLIINQSLCSGIFPDMLKIAKVIPLFKKGDQHLLDNYRPISLLPVISKIFEKKMFLNRHMNILQWINCYIQVSMGFAKVTLRN